MHCLDFDSLLCDNLDPAKSINSSTSSSISVHSSSVYEPSELDEESSVYQFDESSDYESDDSSNWYLED